MGKVYLAVIIQDDFESFRKLLHPNFPDTYDEWRNLRAKWHKNHRTEGDTILDVNIKPDEFIRFLNATGKGYDLQCLLTLAEEISNGRRY